MPSFRIGIGALDTFYEIEGADDERHAWQLFSNMKMSDFLQQVELGLGEPELIREERPLRSIKPYLTPVS